MSDLLDSALAAHGGLERWRELTQLTVDLSVGGSSWPSDGVLARTTATLDTRNPRVTYEPFGSSRHRSLYTPNRVEIADANGTVVAERDNPRAAFAGLTPQSPWDDLHKAYFAGYALWNYLSLPYLLAEDGVETQEVEPWEQDGETWRRLTAHFPASITTHNADQTFYFDNKDFLLRRHDYNADVLGGFATAHYSTDYRTFDGFTLPTRRWVVPRTPDNHTLEGPVVVSIDIYDLTTS